MEEKQEKEKGNFWLTVASFIVNKRKAIEILFVLAIIYSVLSINKVQVNQDITSYLPADSETDRAVTDGGAVHNLWQCQSHGLEYHLCAGGRSG